MDAVNKLQDGNILCGGVGSGKSRTSLYYYFKEYGGSYEYQNYIPMKNPSDLYIITTARKRDVCEWELELALFRMSTDPKLNVYKNKIVVDSWNNIEKYKDIQGAFFILDEQKLKGNGTWVHTFYKIAKNNRWILLSATPADRWLDYIPVMVANGFYKNRTEFYREHVIFNRHTTYPKVDRYINTGRLIHLRNRLLVDISVVRTTVPHHEDVYCTYDIQMYKDVTRNRWDPYKDIPIENAGVLCFVMRRVVNTSEDRQMKLLELIEKHQKAIIFYNFDYELEILENLYYGENFKVAQWNGHKHEPVPRGDKWVYLCHYGSAEAWNCITTDTIIFYSQNYSYSTMNQASGRIDRLNTPYKDLYYYHLKSRSGIDLAISKALSEKKNFNEGKFIKW